jgi:cytochrome c556
MQKTAAACAALLALAPLLARADAVDDAIKARQGFYDLVSHEMGALAAMAKGEAPYDATAAAAHARDLRALSGYALPELFVAGSAKPERSGKTRALPEIWADKADFEAKFGDFVSAVSAFQSQAGAGQAALGPALGKVGATCKACHDAYRAKDF